MPFRLTNALSTFQATINDIFRAHLRRFVLVFFNDILIYSPDWTSHLTHLREVLKVLQLNSLFLKHSKCEFATQTVSYLGHIISFDGVSVDPSKFEAVVDWPRPKSVKALRGFP